MYVPVTGRHDIAKRGSRYARTPSQVTAALGACTRIHGRKSLLVDYFADVHGDAFSCVSIEGPGIDFSCSTNGARMKRAIT